MPVMFFDCLGDFLTSRRLGSGSGPVLGRGEKGPLLIAARLSQAPV